MAGENFPVDARTHMQTFVNNYFCQTLLMCANVVFLSSTSSLIGRASSVFRPRLLGIFEHKLLSIRKFIGPRDTTEI